MEQMVYPWHTRPEVGITAGAPALRKHFGKMVSFCKSLIEELES